MYSTDTLLSVGIWSGRVDLEPFVLSLSLFALFFGLCAVIAVAYAPAPSVMGLVVFVILVVVVSTVLRLWRRRRA